MSRGKKRYRPADSNILTINFLWFTLTRDTKSSVVTVKGKHDRDIAHSFSNSFTVHERDVLSFSSILTKVYPLAM